jgi:Protein of unknown function (DUF3618)
VGTTEDDLRRDAQHQRERMGETLEAIGDRLSPERIVERRKAAVGRRFRSMKETVMGSPDYDEFDPSSGGLRGRAEGVASSASEALQSATEQVQQAPQAIAAQASGNPLAAGLVAFGVGALLASVFPKTRTEQHLVQEARPQLDSAAEELKRVGRDVAFDAKDRTTSAAAEVKAAGESAAESVRDQARESSENMRDQDKGMING